MISPPRVTTTLLAKHLAPTQIRLHEYNSIKVASQKRTSSIRSDQRILARQACPHHKGLLIK